MSNVKVFVGLAALLAMLAGCGSGSGLGDIEPVTPAPDFPTPPALGEQIDRQGRAAITTALIQPLGPLVDGADNSRKDEYSVAGRAEWDEFFEEIRSAIAIYDGLDANCGSQILAGAGVEPEDFDTPARYDALAGALTDDRLYLNADSGACSQYFAVELAATGLIPALEGDCGGRTPLYDTIDVSYTALSNDLSIPVTDGIAMDDNRNHSLDLFPFLAPVVE
ncbi:MAG: hypothetical protein JJU22_18400 [Gammaproteobacteria bacterium]|nr:hypothetical protein [Gammaproteobacteria bacterium]